jgi:precorrin-6B methylase 2
MTKDANVGRKVTDTGAAQVLASVGNGSGGVAVLVVEIAVQRHICFAIERLRVSRRLP